MINTILKYINQKQYFLLIIIWHTIFQKLCVCFTAIRSKQQWHWYKVAYSREITIVHLSKIQYQILGILTLNSFDGFCVFITRQQKDTLVTIAKLHISLIEIISSHQLSINCGFSNNWQIIWVSESVLYIPTNTIQNNITA